MKSRSSQDLFWNPGGQVQSCLRALACSWGECVFWGPDPAQSLGSGPRVPSFSVRPTLGTLRKPTRDPVLSSLPDHTGLELLVPGTSRCPASRMGVK